MCNTYGLLLGFSGQYNRASLRCNIAHVKKSKGGYLSWIDCGLYEMSSLRTLVPFIKYNGAENWLFHAFVTVKGRVMIFIMQGIGQKSMSLRPHCKKWEVIWLKNGWIRAWWVFRIELLHCGDRTHWVRFKQSFELALCGNRTWWVRLPPLKLYCLSMALKRDVIMTF